MPWRPGPSARACGRFSSGHPLRVVERDVELEHVHARLAEEPERAPLGALRNQSLHLFHREPASLGDPGCLRQWQTGLARRKSRIRAVHIADLLAAAAGGRALPQGLPLAARLPQVRLPSGMRVRRVFRLR